MRQQRLADAANTSRQRIHQLCKGHAPRTSTALADRIEKALGRPRGSLFVPRAARGGVQRCPLSRHG
ncbi:hypothetical protein [Allokutzneria albata]|uniref:hypothetical protein n=1 Tax=Allokutzneria albata TaxID=211114 RepID=UPI0038991A97